jgi:hypothetical protein
MTAWVEHLLRLWRLRSLAIWIDTMGCKHRETQRSALIDSGRRKMFWCTRCERTWFS